jgi:hypothetical protein
MVHRSSLILIMIAALVLAGCQVETRPIDVANFSTNRAPTQLTAAYDGTYVLYNDDSDTTVGPILMTTRLKQGETLGFEIDSDHLPYATAGKDRLQLQPGRYRWQMTPDKGQTDWGKTNTVVIEVVVATAVVALIAVSAIVATKGL